MRSDDSARSSEQEGYELRKPQMRSDGSEQEGPELYWLHSELERLKRVSDGLAASLTESRRRSCSETPSARPAELRERLLLERNLCKELRHLEAAEREAVDAIRRGLVELQAGVREAEDEKHRMLALIETKRGHLRRFHEMAPKQSEIILEHAALLHKLHETSAMMEHDDAEVRSAEGRVTALRDTVCAELFDTTTDSERHRGIQREQALLSACVGQRRDNERARAECESAKAELALLCSEASRQRAESVAAAQANASMLAAIRELERERALLGEERTLIAARLESYQLRTAHTRIEIQARAVATVRMVDRVEAQTDSMRRCGLKHAEACHAAQMLRIAAIHQTLRQSL